MFNIDDILTSTKNVYVEIMPFCSTVFEQVAIPIVDPGGLVIHRTQYIVRFFYTNIFLIEGLC